MEGRDGCAERMASYVLKGVVNLALEYQVLRRVLLFCYFTTQCCRRSTSVLGMVPIVYNYLLDVQRVQQLSTLSETFDDTIATINGIPAIRFLLEAIVSIIELAVQSDLSYSNRFYRLETTSQSSPYKPSSFFAYQYLPNMSFIEVVDILACNFFEILLHRNRFSSQDPTKCYINLGYLLPELFSAAKKINDADSLRTVALDYCATLDKNTAITLQVTLPSFLRNPTYSLLSVVFRHIGPIQLPYVCEMAELLVKCGEAVGMSFVEGRGSRASADSIRNRNVFLDQFMNYLFESGVVKSLCGYLCPVPPEKDTYRAVADDYVFYLVKSIFLYASPMTLDHLEANQFHPLLVSPVTQTFLSYQTIKNLTTQAIGFCKCLLSTKGHSLRRDTRLKLLITGQSGDGLKEASLLVSVLDTFCVFQMHILDIVQRIESQSGRVQQRSQYSWMDTEQRQPFPQISIGDYQAAHGGISLYIQPMCELFSPLVHVGLVAAALLEEARYCDPCGKECLSKMIMVTTDVLQLTSLLLPTPVGHMLKNPGAPASQYMNSVLNLQPASRVVHSLKSALVKIQSRLA